MRLLIIQRTLGIFLMLYSGSLLPPLALSLYYGDHWTRPFTETLLLTLAIGLLLWLPTYRQGRVNLRRREGFLIVALFWVVMSGLSALPFVFGGLLDFTRAFFEAASAFTTTGATVLTGLDSLPRSLLFYRQELQWLGGMGIIVLAVAILPMLGIGGMSLFKAETPGPVKDDKLTPRIAHGARIFWGIYVGLTLTCALAYWLAGMGPFDAIAHSLSTLSTGGFSPHDASLAYFDSAAIEAVANVFMLLGGINFSLHFLVWHNRNLRAYFADTELKAYLAIIFFSSLLIALTLYLAGTYTGFGTALRHAVFNVITFLTSTGFVTQDYSAWPLFIPTLLFLIAFIGGSSGSTAGGFKVMRVVLLFKQGLLGIRRLIHPAVVSSIRYNDRVMPERTMDAVWGFFALYIATYVLIMLALMANGIDMVTAYASVTTTLNNTGPGLGMTGSNFATLDAVSYWLLSFTMLLGRLEIFTLLVIFSPGFWRS